MIIHHPSVHLCSELVAMLDVPYWSDRDARLHKLDCTNCCTVLKKHLEFSYRHMKCANGGGPEIEGSSAQRQRSPPPQPALNIGR